MHPKKHQNASPNLTNNHLIHFHARFDHPLH